MNLFVQSSNWSPILEALSPIVVNIVLVIEMLVEWLLGKCKVAVSLLLLLIESVPSFGMLFSLSLIYLNTFSFALVSWFFPSNVAEPRGSNFPAKLGSLVEETVKRVLSQKDAPKYSRQAD